MLEGVFLGDQLLQLVFMIMLVLVLMGRRVIVRLGLFVGLIVMHDFWIFQLLFWGIEYI